MSGKKLIRTVPENFDHKKTVNPKQANNLKAQQHRVANVALDSGAVATLVNDISIEKDIKTKKLLSFKF